MGRNLQARLCSGEQSRRRETGNVPSNRRECFPRFCTGGVEVGPVGTSGLGGASEGEAVSLMLMGGGEGGEAEDGFWSRSIKVESK
ncbi:hypothetical protein N7471_006304 [Penicillium samsonianum]|uniref:uncharacterized protein n=1 Tax=Penicillium samsonianum TaxID=1882272 RepID=UPI0025469B3B|nr:uncharacterized protein N7471_006304 [Penicillium samsonianum]KAJ6139818.1 hypothetical protein N7471_006304 [Penicillium samsonianum]